MDYSSGIKKQTFARGCRGYERDRATGVQTTTERRGDCDVTCAGDARNIFYRLESCPLLACTRTAHESTTPEEAVVVESAGCNDPAAAQKKKKKRNNRKKAKSKSEEEKGHCFDIAGMDMDEVSFEIIPVWRHHLRRHPVVPRRRRVAFDVIFACMWGWGVAERFYGAAWALSGRSRRDGRRGRRP